MASFRENKMKCEIIELYPSVMNTPLFKVTKIILTESKKRQGKEAGVLACLSTLEKHDVKLEVVK